MTNAEGDRGSPVRVQARLDTSLSRGLWLVKWLLLVPHLAVLLVLGVAFWTLTVVAFVTILVTGRYPRVLFGFNVGVLRWGWRVAWYGYGGLGTDRYPRFTLADRSDDPARLDIAYPHRLSRGLVLVKWWLLALPHYAVLVFLIGVGGTVVARVGTAGAFGLDGGLLSLLVLIVGVMLLFTATYPAGLFGLITGIDRWVLRVVAYAGLMTDNYPPMRLDQGGTDPAGPLPDDTATAGTATARTAAEAAEGTTTVLTRAEAPPAAPAAPPPPRRAILLTAGAWLLLLGAAAAIAAGTDALAGAAFVPAVAAGAVLGLVGIGAIAVGARPLPDAADDAEPGDDDANPGPR